MHADVFHSYDIRGLAGEELNEPFARRLGKCLVRLFGAKKIIVGRDMRPSSEDLEQALVEAL
ncbi:MAG TPA: phosphomannomutase, partial [Patescibacteria group bacterium]|nr:phosphomannomutase [Patescibacteria group bacterium]